MFFEMLSAINDPNKQGSIDQLSQITGTVQQLAKSQQLSNDQMGTVMSALGGALKPALKQQSDQLGGGQIINMMNQLTGSSNNTAMLQSMIPPQIQQQIAQAIATKTGLDAGMVQAMMPQLLNTVLDMFRMGASKPNVTVTGSNPLLNAFLDSNRDGSTDMADVVKFAGRFLNAPN